MPDRAEELLSLGSWVRRRRKALDLTQAVLADRVGCAVVTIRKIEVDAMRPSRGMAERLAHCLDLSLDERAVFLRVASGERGFGHLPPPLAGTDIAPLAVISAPSPVVPFPLDTLPHPAPLPADSRMPLSRNPLFVGRDADLRQIARALNAGGTAAIGQLKITATTGLGGIGKTQLACEFVHRYGQYFAGGVFWLSFADPAAVPAEVAACGGVEGMQLSPEYGTLPLDQQVQQVLAAWRSPLPRLLVFDNCETERLLHDWRPKHGGCRVLITSRRHHWDVALGVQPLPLDVLPRAESITLLRTFRPDLSAADPDLDAIAAELGDLPLALHLAGSFLAKYRYMLTPAQYRTRLHTPTILDDRSLQGAGLSPTEHVQHVARTFAQSSAQLDPADPTDALARTLLAHAACFAPGESLPRWLLLQTLEVSEHDEDRLILAEDALMRLIDLGLLEPDTAGGLRLHRLLVAFVRMVLEHETAQSVVEATMLRVADALNEQQNPRPLLSIQPHLRYIVEAAQARGDAHAAALCNALGYHGWQLGVYAEAQGYLEQALAIRQRILGMNHPDTALSLHNLSNVVKDRGQYAKAQGYLEQALAIRERVFGLDHPQTTMSLNNLAVVFYHQGQYAEAQRYLEQTLATRERALGSDHPLIARSLNNLGVVLRAQGQFAKAQGYHTQALAIRERVLGLDHPDTAYSFNNLGEVLQAQGQYAEARYCHEQALTIRKRMLGIDHPETARSLRGLGEVLQAQEETVQARCYLEQALLIFEQRLGSDHPDAEQARRTLAALNGVHSTDLES